MNGTTSRSRFIRALAAVGACGAFLAAGGPATGDGGPVAHSAAAEPERITLKAGQTVTTKTVFKEGASYRVDVSGAVSQPLGDGGVYTVDAFYGESSTGPSAGAPRRDGGLTGKAWDYNDTLERFTSARTAPPFNSARSYTIVLDRVFDGTMELTARSGSGEFSITITPPAAATTGGTEVTLADVSRKVEVSRAESGWEAATNGMKLGNGDRVHTGFKSGVTMTFPGGTRLLVRDMVLLQITNVSVGPSGGVSARMLLKTGQVTAQVNRSTGARGDFEVKTPTSAASVRGTIFTVHHDGTATTVTVTEGNVAVTSNSGTTVVVPAGSETRSTATSVTPPVPIGRGFTSGGLSSTQALARLTSKLASGLRRCKFGVVSNRLAPVAGGWSASFVIVGAAQGIKAKPKGTARLRLKGTRVSPSNALAKRIIGGCRRR